MGWYVPHALSFSLSISPSLPFLLIPPFLPVLSRDESCFFLHIWACHCLILLDPLPLTFFVFKLGAILVQPFRLKTDFSNFVPFSFSPRFTFLSLFSAYLCFLSPESESVVGTEILCELILSFPCSPSHFIRPCCTPAPSRSRWASSGLNLEWEPCSCFLY